MSKTTINNTIIVYAWKELRLADGLWNMHNKSKEIEG
jgi:hypothetical protein